MKTIGFFGDSYCAVNNDLSCFAPEYQNIQTYISLLATKYNLEITNLGYPGSSVYDCLLLQFDPLRLSNTLPDVTVFVWTDPGRLFHRTIRDINFGTSQQSKHLGSEWEAAYLYYKELHDFDLSKFQCQSVMYYYDHAILPEIVDKTKIIHVWGFGEFIGKKFDRNKPLNSKDLEYGYRWKTGTEIRPALSTLSVTGIDPGPNHIGSQEQNNIACDWISTAIDNYENGKLLEF